MASIAKIIQAEHADLDPSSKKEWEAQWFDEYLRNSKRDGSIPDGWIFACNDSKPACVVIMEDKLHVFDPNQIHNHMEKAF